MTTLHARSNAEAHLYMDQQPCPCGAREFDRRSTVITEGDALCCRYAGPCQRCGRRREFVFELAEPIRPVAGRIEYGGSDPSRLLDPGEWMDIADAHATRQPGTPRDLDIARAAIEEVLKFIPASVERVPDEAFRTARGRAVRDAEPGRFRRPRLEAVLGVYRELAENARPAPAARKDATPPLAAAAAAPAPAQPLDQLPVPALIDALALAVARREGFEGNDLRRHASDFSGQIHTLVRMYQIKAREELQRRQSTAEVERLLDGLVRTGAPIAAVIAAHRADIIDAFRQLDLAAIGSGLQVLMQWMRSPTAGHRASVEQLLADLQATPGTASDASAAREADASRERINQAVGASLAMFSQGPATDPGEPRPPPSPDDKKP
jgi:hypothetical protein